ncbi:MAG TPA: hypothetical protein ENL35_04220 [Chloroflexi bacterium]|nr:hypothetical protein [Chloroflexota bacterium]
MLTFRDVAVDSAHRAAMMEEAERERLIRALENERRGTRPIGLRLRLYIASRLLAWGWALIRQAEVQGVLIALGTQNGRSAY